MSNLTLSDLLGLFLEANEAASTAFENKRRIQERINGLMDSSDLAERWKSGEKLAVGDYAFKRTSYGDISIEKLTREKIGDLSEPDVSNVTSASD